MARLPRTFADDEPGAEWVRAGCCGRLVFADFLVDCERVSVAHRQRGARYLCDGCRETLLREGRMTRTAFQNALKDREVR